jgi:D-alanyl-D-alanine carboxypeptidase (penicillin-binding protein 5/6)
MPIRFRSPLGVLLLFVPLVACSPGSTPPTPPPVPSEAPVLVRPVLPVLPPPSVRGGSSIVIDAASGRILAGKVTDERRAIASTQKLLTALLVIEDGSLDRKVTVQRSDTLVEPTKLYFKPGEVYTRRELLRVIMVRSANDAAVALARDVAGSVEAFAERMTRRARSLGMRNSAFKNPHGLTEPGQYSTARDLAILARAAYRQPFIRQCMRTKKFTFVFNDGRTRVLTNTNKLLKRYSYITGMKTGTTNASGKCLVSAAEYNGRVAISVILKSTNAVIWDDSNKLLRWALNIPPGVGAL